MASEFEGNILVLGQLLCGAAKGVSPFKRTGDGNFSPSERVGRGEHVLSIIISLQILDPAQSRRIAGLLSLDFGAYGVQD